MLTALDIQNKEFTRGMRGYKEEEVDEFLDQIIVDFQTLVARNEELTQQLEEAQTKFKEVKSTEGSVISTLESAKALMNEISESAERRAQVLIKNAEMDAELKLRQTNSEVEKLRSEEAALRIRVESFKNQYRNLLEKELEVVKNVNSAVFGE